MLRQYELVERVRAYDPDVNEDLLNRAYVFSMKAHGSQLRASGDPYFSHPIEVAGILTDLQLDDETIATGILHDTVEDTVATPEQIERLFGANVARLVDGVTKLSRIEAQTDTERAAENLRKFLLAMSDDIRVLLVKLADRLHNMRTLHHIPSAEKRKRIARETMDIYAPLAERIGMYDFMDELQELSFRELEPEASESVSKRLASLRVGSGDMVSRLKEGIKLLLMQNGIEAEVSGREKRPFSIWRKMQSHDLTFEQLVDVMAFRVIVEDPAHCYRALGIIHRRWPAIPGRFKDFISTPKHNGYRSLHTSVIHNERVRIEIQIRDTVMHTEAEIGLAAHWAYKQGDDGAAARESYPWIRDLLDIIDDAASPEELLEHTKLAMFQDQVFCFTPKGELYQLPRGATPVDFAYALHTSLGDTCIGAKVNGRDVGLRQLLTNGDQVEIIRLTDGHPDPAWESFIVSAKARSAVRRYVRRVEREAQLELGSKLYAEIVARLKPIVSTQSLETALVRLKLPDLSAVYIALAKQSLSDNTVLEALAPGSTARKKSRSTSKAGENFGQKTAIAITGLVPGVAYRLGQCCHPIPGDQIIGLRRAGTGVEVHNVDCESLEPIESGEWLKLAWSSETVSAVAQLVAVVRNQPGSLAEVTGILADSDTNIFNITLRDRDRQFHTFVIDLEVDGVAHLQTIIAALRPAASVVSVERVHREV